MHLFYSEQIFENEATLSPEESKHAIQVLRLRSGDQAQVFDGKGNLYHAVFSDVTTKMLKANVTFIKQDTPLPYHLHIAIAPTKQTDRFEWFVEKAIEMGVHKITPIICHDSVRLQLKTDRIHKIKHAACKQSWQLYLPIINEPIQFNEFIKQHQGGLIAHCKPETKSRLDTLINKQSNVVMVIGPEGDFTAKEISWALQHNYKPVSLGNSRLRTETAGVYVSAYMRSLLN
jgi:16S rRNA (uracil1498-N3)-methyltransferase